MSCLGRRINTLISPRGIFIQHPVFTQNQANPHNASGLADGTGYVEDGREIFDDDLDDDVVENKGKNPLDF